MSIALDSTSDNSGAIEVGGVQRIILGADGGAELHQSPTQESPPKHIATMEALWAYGGMPRFTPYVWGGKASAMPAGDTQSSGQQLLDLMYPDMRADVVATQFTCTETEWQADPYKRVTHWSLGEPGWMRPPDKNGVQPGNVGPFYGTGSNPAGAKTGTAVIDAMRDIAGTLDFSASTNTVAATALIAATGVFKLEQTLAGGRSTSTVTADMASARTASFRASNALPAGTTTDPITGEFRPRTWYGIWMIRMYGRVLNTGTLDAAGLNARMDMIDARVAALEGRELPIGQGQTYQSVMLVSGSPYTNDERRTIGLIVNKSNSSSVTVTVGAYSKNDQSNNTMGMFLIPAGSAYSVTGSIVSAHLIK